MINELNLKGNELLVYANSLFPGFGKSTDEDIIKQIFELAKSIRILYHNDTSVKNNIKNLVEIYGKDGFDRLRQEKDLQFLPQSQIYWNNAANK